MVARNHGTWSKVHDGIDEHPKTQAAAAVLAAALGVDRDYAAAVVVRAVGRLVRWATRESDSGRTGHLRDAQILAIAWPAAVEPGGVLWGKSDLSVLRRALREVPDGYETGFLADVSRGGHGRAGVEVIHEFHLYAWYVLRDRPHYKGTRLEDWLAAPLGAATETAGRTGPSAGDGPVGSTGATLAAGAPVAGGGGTAAPGSTSDPVHRFDGGVAHAGAQPGARSVPGPFQVPPSEGSRSAAGSGQPVRNPLSILDPLRADSARAPCGTPRAIGSVPAATAAERDQSGSGGGPGAFGGVGWKGVPFGLETGAPEIVAAWTRSLPPMGHARLYAGRAYLDRMEQHTGVLPPEAAADPAVTPGAALEIADPDAWSALQADLIAHLPRVAFPRKYTARALALRWEEILGKAADAAQERRARWRAEGRA